MSADPITYFDRYAAAEKQEAVYGDGALRFAYENAAGRVLTWLLFSRPLISRIFGWYMKRSRSAGRVAPFVRKYGLKADEFAQPVESFTTFNDFFCRELKASARPVDQDAESVVFPADARHLGFQETVVVLASL